MIRSVAATPVTATCGAAATIYLTYEPRDEVRTLSL